ncbi:hypothetical protein MMU07_09220 [Aquiflexum sp. LQ15W]|uniref:hypothetical protein n=1 Tax=Cognataquiflexum nitidum TaxID=2922272 RepID=UPI001F132316|nr:hypothetical protein [Cognataquiflexum nitidum]MCH6199760.1 hypothetical protein [Cognataquiflexum nitidum]
MKIGIWALAKEIKKYSPQRPRGKGEKKNNVFGDTNIGGAVAMTDHVLVKYW